jgi:hypothetical protein
MTMGRSCRRTEQILPLHHDAGDSAAASGTEQEDGHIWWSCRRCLVNTIHETKYRRSKRSASTQCHHLRDAAMKDTAGVGVEIRQIYSPKCGSHHPNSVPWKFFPYPNYQARTEVQGHPPSCHRSGKRRERRPAASPTEIEGKVLPTHWQSFTGANLGVLSLLPPPPAAKIKFLD